MGAWPTRSRRRAVAAIALALLLTGATSPALAGSLRLTPVRVDIAQDGQFCSLSISNDRDQPVTVQVRGFGWTQDQSGSEILDPAAGLVVNPEIFSLRASETKLVRCAVPAATGEPNEQAWRLIVDELPPPDLGDSGTVRALLRMSIPVFRTPGSAEPDLEITPLAGADAKHRFIVHNRGSAHVKVLGFITQDGGQRERTEQPFYLLAGATREVELPVEFAGQGMIVKAETVMGDVPVRIARRVEPATGPAL